MGLVCGWASCAAGIRVGFVCGWYIVHRHRRAAREAAEVAADLEEELRQFRELHQQVQQTSADIEERLHQLRD